MRLLPLQAEEFHSAVHILLEWLAEAEQSLRFHGSLPDDEEALRALIEQHKVKQCKWFCFFISEKKLLCLKLFHIFVALLKK